MEINIIINAPETCKIMEAFIQEQSMGDYIDLPIETIRDSKAFTDFLHNEVKEHLFFEVAFKFKEVGAVTLLELRIVQAEILTDDRILVKLERVND